MAATHSPATPMFPRHLAPALVALITASGPAARAAPAPPDPLRPVAYAVVVGTNRGGPGQGALRYAEQDARRVAELLRQLGGYHPDRVELLQQPEREELFRALGRAAGKLQAHAARGEKSVFLFYYSGHARSSGLNLGPETFPLDQLRGQLVALPSTVVLAVLDACQSGAFSRVKGAEPAADFSYNSVTQLSTAGIAVMASSGASELSQESDRLQSSFFTHHLLAALRGAADLDRDGHVTLAEAYRYSYHRTLADTASTSVGSQHATLETGLRGKGEVVLSYPAQASAQLDLPGPLAGQLLIERRPSGSVIAELHKASGEGMRLALAPGDYRAVWRRDGEVRECRFQLRDGQVTAVDTEGCTVLADETVALKGRGAPHPRWAVDVGFGISSGDGYQEAFGDRGFRPRGTIDHLTFDLAGVRSIGQNLELRLNLRPLDSARNVRRFETGEREHFSWRVFAFGPEARGLVRFGRLSLYLQLGFGMTLGRTSYTTALDAQDRPTEASQVVHTWFPGMYVSLANGLMVRLWKNTQLFLQYRYTEVNDIGLYDGGVNQGGHYSDPMIGFRLGW
jgi:hypothetical protein